MGFFSDKKHTKKSTTVKSTNINIYVLIQQYITAELSSLHTTQAYEEKGLMSSSL